MAIIDIPDAMGAADRSLSAVVGVTLQNNLSHCNDESGYYHGGIGDNSVWTRTTVGDDEWEKISDWIGMPVQLRYNTDGTWRQIDVTLRAQVGSGTATVRAYMLPSPVLPASSIDVDDAIVGVETYDDNTVTTTPTDYKWSVTPEIAEDRRGDGSILGFTFHFGWIFFICKSPTAGAKIDLWEPRIVETF